MKTYYKDYPSLAQAWVNGQIGPSAYTAKNRMIAYGPSDFAPQDPVKGSIYSYGSHFCIARKWQAPDTGRIWYLVTLRSFSPTTRRQIKAVRRAIPAEQLVYLPQVDDLTTLGIEGAERLVPEYRLDLRAPSSCEALLGSFVYHHEVSTLDEHVASYLRSRVPFSIEYLNGWIDRAQQSISRFGLTLPSRFDTAKDQCAAHYYHRQARNAVLATTLPARRRLLAA